MDGTWTERRSGRRRHADEARDDFEIDYARVVHSGSFRSLQGKTQILSLGDDDFYRTRLTHSLEVAQVAEGLVQHLRQTVRGPAAELVPCGALVRALGLAHDIGHPPFGHGGELALNYCMRGHGGFEGNAHTLRLMARLETYSDGFGADLTRRTLLGLLKYPAMQSAARNPAIEPALATGPTTFCGLDEESCRPVKACFDADSEIIDWILQPLRPEDRRAFVEAVPRPGEHAKTRHKSLDCSVMDAADDIAYGVHDLEDALALDLIGELDFRSGVSADLCEGVVESLARRPIEGIEPTCDGIVAGLFGTAGLRKRLIGRLVHHLIRSTRIEPVADFEDPLLAWRLTMPDRPKRLLGAFRDLITACVIKSPRVQHLEFKGQRMVVATFEALASSPDLLLPGQVCREYRRTQNDPRAICDYVASLTDAALLRLYDRLFSPRMGTVFDRI